MALDPLELGTIEKIIIVFFIWGPQKIPELARLIGQARKEFDNATKEFQKVSTGLQNPLNPLFAPSPATRTAAPAPQVRSALPQSAANAPTSAATTQPPTTGTKTGDELLIEAARRLGIPTQGKTREQIQEDIISLKQGTSTKERAPDPPVADDAEA
jgi:Sec-independent protein translocase protein TatA